MKRQEKGLRLLAVCLSLVLAGCGSQPTRAPESGPGAEPGSPAVPARKPAAVVQKRGGGYYKDDGPADEIPDNLDAIPDAQPRLEALHRFANNPYVVLGKSYVPNTVLKPVRQRGVASWYGKKFHGQKTSIGEPYDMFAMTAAHPTLAIPSYVRVTNVGSGKSVVVRVTDRGPFHADRIIDLSYAAAYRLGYVNNGSTLVEGRGLAAHRAHLAALRRSPPARIASEAGNREGRARRIRTVDDAIGDGQRFCGETRRTAACPPTRRKGCSSSLAHSPARTTPKVCARTCHANWNG